MKDIDSAKANHRCKGSLDAGVSIRYSKKFHHIKDESEYATWRLFKADHSDYDFDNITLRYIYKINNCPFCGKELKKL